MLETAALDLLVFILKAFVILVTFSLIVMIIVSARRGKQTKSQMDLEDLSEKWQEQKIGLLESTLSEDDFKIWHKSFKKEQKKAANESKAKVYVLDFDGDTQASATVNLREEINAVLLVADPKDEVVIRLESPGGMVHGYGDAAAQLLRLREAGIKTTVCVDRVAASGGYMMACTADKILASPFAILGSIGVVAQVPNLHKILKKNDVDFKEYTAGDYKRTVSLLGEITEKGEKKFLEQLEATHSLFKDFVSRYRPQLDINSVSTGEYWYGQQALALKLCDEISTSDSYLMSKATKCKVIHVEHKEPTPLLEKVIGKSVDSALHRLSEKLFSRIQPL